MTDRPITSESDSYKVAQAYFRKWFRDNAISPSVFSTWSGYPDLLTAMNDGVAPDEIAGWFDGKLKALSTTLTGVLVSNIGAAFNKPYPKWAYSSVIVPGIKGATDVDGYAVRDRFEEIFGAFGVGWYFEPHPTLGRTDYTTRLETTKDGKQREVTFVMMLNWCIKFATIKADETIWLTTGYASDAGKNSDPSYALRGAETSLMKHFLRSFGGFNHLRDNKD